jgi:polar amino acid transport system substrate-binding protein
MMVRAGNGKYSVAAGAAFALLAAASLLGAKPVQAQTCGTEYVVKNGDSLADIAARVYGRASDWSILLYANQDRLGSNASLMVPGLSIRIPCVGEANKPLPEVATTPAQEPVPAQQPSFIVSSTLSKIEFLTADGFAPFTGRSLPNGGMITELLSKAMELIKDESKGHFDYGISWVNDWASHLNPLLASRAFDAGYPWIKPDCNNLASLDADARYRCQKFFFSQPLHETLTHMFVKQHSKLDWDDEQKYVGRNFCRPAGYTTYEFDQDGRNWLKGNKITLIRAPSVEECFHLLDAGSVDAVVVPDLVGQGVMSSMRLADKVRMLEKPFAIHTLHVIVTKSHPQARTILYYINASLSKLRESGEFDSIVEAHLARFWDSQGGFNASDESAKRPAPPPAKGGTLIEPPTSTASTPAKDNEGGSPKQPRTNTSIAKGDKK